MRYETVIGLEVHVELSTKTKAFCSCSTEFGGKPNSHICPVCTGMPGALPVVNKKAVDYAIKAGLALNCGITRFGRFDRKNYFYPDAPKNYQITQDKLPICTEGFVEIKLENGEMKKIGIERIHLEEDAGKQLHTSRGTLVDFNRSGVPLIEIVSKPDMRSAEEAVSYMTKLRSILEATGVSDVKMEQGSLRVDLNVSIMEEGSEKFGLRTEVKNLNSFRSMERAVEYEVRRQREALERGEEPAEMTRRWDEEKGETVLMRRKERADDYRYFPEGDLTSLNIDDEWIEEIRQSIPELPHEKAERFIKDFGITEYDAMVLTLSGEMAEFFDEAAKVSGDGKACANWLMGDISKLMNEDQITAGSLKFKPSDLADLTGLIKSGKISSAAGKKVVEEMYKTGEKPEALIEKLGLSQVSDEGEILKAVREVLEKNPNIQEDYSNGKTKIVGYGVGLVMKATKGRANPGIINKLMNEELEKGSKN